MRKRYAGILFAGCAGVLAAALTVTTARAATTWTIRPGGAVTAKSGTATFKDTKTRQLFTCQSLSARGMLKTGGGLPGSHAGSISAVGFRTCTSPLGRFRAPRIDLIWMAQATGLPWHVNFSSFNGGVVTGTISHMQIKLSWPSRPQVLVYITRDGTRAATSARLTIGNTLIWGIRQIALRLEGNLGKKAALAIANPSA